jgi:hypothetical protein
MQLLLQSILFPVLAGCGVFHFFGDDAAFDLDGRTDVAAAFRARK